MANAHQCPDRREILCSTVQVVLEVEEERSAFVTATMINLASHLKGRKPKKLTSIFDSPMGIVSLFRHGRSKDGEDIKIVLQPTTPFQEISTNFLGRGLSTRCMCYASNHLYLCGFQPPESQTFFYHFQPKFPVEPYPITKGTVIVLESDHRASFVSLKKMNMVASGVLIKVNGLGSQNDRENRISVVYEGTTYNLSNGLAELINGEYRPFKHNPTTGFAELINGDRQLPSEFFHLMVYDDWRSAVMEEEKAVCARLDGYIDRLSLSSAVIWAMIKKAGSLGNLGTGLLKTLSAKLATRVNTMIELGIAAVKEELNLAD